MTAQDNPWHECADRILSEKSVRQRLSVPVLPVHSARFLDGEAVTNHLQSLYVPYEPDINLACAMLARAAGQMRLRYPSRAKFNKRVMQQPSSAPLPMAPTILSGYAGCGKTQLIARIKEVFGVSIPLVFEDFNGLTMGGVWAATCEPRISASRLYAQVEEMARCSLPGKGAGRQVATLRSCAYRDAIFLVILDELQFVAFSQGARAAAIALIQAMANIDLPLVVVSNFDMVRKLQTAQHQIPQRLLRDPRVMFPRIPGSDAWHHHVTSVLDTMPGDFELEIAEHSDELWRFTAGLPRALEQLFVVAFELTDRQGSGRVGWEEIKRAYQTSKYAVYRRDADDIYQYLVTRQTKRSDLILPFGEKFPVDLCREDEEQSDLLRQAVWDNVKSNSSADEQQAICRARKLAEYERSLASKGKSRHAANDGSTVEGLLEGVRLAVED